MNTIEFPRIGVDGVSRTASEIEEWYVKSPEIEAVYYRILKIHAVKDANEILKYIKGNFYKLIVGKPDELENIRLMLDAKCKVAFKTTNSRNGKVKKSKFYKKIENAFRYTENRKGIVVELAKKLNVKSCPYCNHQYTLYVEDGNKVKADFQFDHFIDKSTYPIFSMSLYNLIPSCSLCNHAKSNKALPIIFNPYCSDIFNLYKFRVDSPLSFMTMNNGEDKLEISLVTDTGKASQADLDIYNERFIIMGQYARHKDIVNEINKKTYLEKYYSNKDNFTFISDPKFDRYRLLYGYTKHEDIEKRPMTKFTQDIREQFNNYNHSLRK